MTNPGYDAVAGARVLENFHLTFDYAAGELWARWRPVPPLKQRLADGSLDPNGRDLADHTPLMDAAAAGDLEACRLLLAAGAAADATDRRGVGVLTFAVFGGDVELVRLLLGNRRCGAA